MYLIEVLEVNITELIKGSYVRFLHLLAKHVHPASLRVTLHRMRGVKIGRNVFIGLEVNIDDYNPEYITIENNVFITARSMPVVHMPDMIEYSGEGKWIGDCSCIQKPIRIKEGAFIGIGAIIMPGVTVGKGAVVGAGSVVTKNVQDYCVVAGVPAKIVKKLDKMHEGEIYENMHH